MSEKIDAGKALTDKVYSLEEITDALTSKEAKYKSLVPFCQKLLEAFGFRTAPCLSSKYDNIKSIRNLIDFFYNRFKYLHRDKVVPAKNEARDDGTAARFVEARVNASGLSKKQALTECAEIVDTVLSNTGRFELVFSIGFRMFGQEDMVWVTDKAIGIMNKKRFHEIPEHTQKAIEKSNDNFDGIHGIAHLIKENSNGKKEDSK